VALLEGLLPLAAVVIALLVGGLVLLALGKDPLAAYAAMLRGAFGSVSGLTQTLTKATPLILVGLGVTIAFRARVINIGAEGQLIVGALGATACALALRTWPGWALLPVTLAAGTLAGCAWGLVPGLLKARLAVNEILTTIMMNAIAIQLMNFLLRGPMLDPAQVAAGTNIPQSEALPQQAWIIRLVPRTLFHGGFFLAVGLAFAVAFVLWRTVLGYRIRAVGLNPDASRYAGIPVATTTAAAMVISAGFCGLAGAIEVLGVHHRVVEGFSGGYGFSGIVVALFGGLHPLGVIPAAILFGGLLVGADQMQRTAQVPAALITALNGLVVLMVVSSTYLVERRAARRQSAAAQSAKQLTEVGREV
jgi:ABC-type uncharacterized transport system permease subunit